MATAKKYYTKDDYLEYEITKSVEYKNELWLTVEYYSPVYQDTDRYTAPKGVLELMGFIFE